MRIFAAICFAFAMSIALASCGREKFADVNSSLENEEYKEAAERASAIISENPKSGEAHMLRGLARYSMKDFKGALDDYDKAIELDPNYSKACLLRLLVRLLFEDYNGALGDISEAVSRNEDNHNIPRLKRIAEFFINESEWRKLDTPEAKQRKEEAYHFRFANRRELGDYKGMLEDIENLINLGRKYYLNRAEVKFALKDYQGAAEDASTSIAGCKEALDIEIAPDTGGRG